MRAILVFLAAITATSAPAQVDEGPCRPGSKADERVLYDMGAGVAIEGERLYVGYYDADFATPVSGGVLVYRREGPGWVFEQALLSDGADPDDAFGVDVAVAGDVVIVPAHEDSAAAPLAGAAWEFRRVGATWERVAKIVAPDAQAFDSLGTCVAFDGTTLVLGALGDHPHGHEAHLFVRTASGWEQVASLSAPHDGTWFGSTCDVEGDTVVVGAMREAEGRAHVYRRGALGWAEETVLAPPSSASRLFGSHVAIGGGTLAVLSNDRTGASALGVVRVYERGPAGWELADALVPPAIGASTQITRCDVSPDGRFLVMADQWADARGTASGVVHLYERTTLRFELRSSFVPSLPPRTRFGRGLAVGTDTVAVGAPAAVIGAASSAWTFDLACLSDRDGDGFPDDADACPDSDTAATVTVGDVDSGVVNRLDELGCTTADRVGPCAAGAGRHGELVSCVAHVTASLRDGGVLSGREGGMLVSAAGRSDLR